MNIYVSSILFTVIVSQVLFPWQPDNLHCNIMHLKYGKGFQCKCKLNGTLGIFILPYNGKMSTKREIVFDMVPYIVHIGKV